MTVIDALQFLKAFLKPTPRQLIPIAVVSFAIAFMAERVTKAVGIHELAQNYRPWFALAFLLAAATLAFDGLETIIQWIRLTNTNRKSLGKLLKRLQTLTEDEKKILRFYILQKTRTNVLDITDGVVNSLVSAGIITRIGNYSEDTRLPYEICEMAWEHLNKHKSVLDGTTTEQRNDKLHRSR